MAEEDYQTWDFTDRHNPQPLVWPLCSECSEPYNYVWGLSFSPEDGQTTTTWSWKRSCKHRKVPPKTHDSRHPAQLDG